jgi:hypothetical protein
MQNHSSYFYYNGPVYVVNEHKGQTSVKRKKEEKTQDFNNDVVTAGYKLTNEAVSFL